MKKRKKVGLALGSGAIRGFSHIGVIKKLLENNIPIDYIAGSSIGSWVGAHYALFQNLEKLEELTVQKQKEKFLSFIEPSINGGVIKGKKIEKLLEEWLEDSDFSDTKIPISIVATDLYEGNTVVLTTGKLAPAVRASMSVPTLFKPVEHQDKILIDGGISNPVPDDVVRAMGADVVISVNLDNYIKNETFTKKQQKSLSKISTRSLNIIRYHLSKYSTSSSDVIIEPYTPTLGINSFRQYFAHKVGIDLVKNGYDETEKHIEKIKKLIK